MAVYHVTIDGVPLQAEDGERNTPASLKNLKEYRTSPVATRYFCKTCGAHVFWRYDTTWLLDDVANPANQGIAERFNIDLEGGGVHGPRAYWCIAVGLLERVSGIVRVGYHIYVEDTLDGGLADHFHGAKGDGGELERWAGWAKTSKLLPKGWRAPGLPSNPHKDRLHFYCQCQGVEFYVTGSSSEKFPARHCECWSCRWTAGFEVVSWGRVPVENIYDKKTGNAIVFGGQAPMGMGEYESSVGRKRYFCSICGASVFLHSIETSKTVDVALGLVDQIQGGARADGWFEWSGSVALEKDEI